MPKRAVPPTTTEIRTAEPAPRRGRRFALYAALLILAVVAALAIADILGRSGQAPATTTQAGVTAVGPMVLSATGLKAHVATLDQAVYWIGALAGERYELRRTTDGSAYVRYLPPGVPAGADPGGYIEIATYPYKGAFAAVKASPRKGKLLTVAGGKGGIASIDRGSPTNVHVAFPHVDYQIEVYAPHAEAARALAVGGSLAPVP